jgi:S-adenosylmethionine:tRNA ribosyltransferase-isomerase
MMVHEEFRKKLTELEKLQFQNTYREVTPEDADRYQTIYAKKKELLQPYRRIALLETFIKRLEIKGIKFAEVTLHGLGTLIQLK